MQKFYLEHISDNKYKFVTRFYVEPSFVKKGIESCHQATMGDYWI